MYKGHNAVLLKDGEPIGLVKDVELNIDKSLEPYFSIQARSASKLVEGVAQISGRFSKAWINTDFLDYLVGNPALTSFDLAVELSTMRVTLYDCSMSKGAVPIPQDGFLKEDYDFIALSYFVEENLECPSGEQITNGGFETGDLTGWSGDAEIVTSADGVISPHSGSYLARSAYNKTRYVEQTLGKNVPQSCLTGASVFKFWFAGGYRSCGLIGTIARAYIEYTDGSKTEVSHETIENEDMIWIEIDLKSYVEVGKTINGIRIEIIDNLTGYGWRACIDDVSLNV